MNGSFKNKITIYALSPNIKISRNSDSIQITQKNSEQKIISQSHFPVRSVFECLVTHSEFMELKDKISKIINFKEDKLAILILSSDKTQKKQVSKKMRGEFEKRFKIY